ncbi:MAG TPA: hypothetical protein RMH99_09950 [Sandaracinaceae bacterium LLY-WYZ-13_1]|nr:hypothetical protein [Sandaracinaceae bacterium LLY-WYZ-13_1]
MSQTPIAWSLALALGLALVAAPAHAQPDAEDASTEGARVEGDEAIDEGDPDDPDDVLEDDVADEAGDPLEEDALEAEPAPTVAAPVGAPPTGTAVDRREAEAGGRDEASAPADDAYWETMVFEPGFQAFGEYGLDLFEDSSGSTDWFHRFDVPRVWLWTGWRLGDVRARLLFEGTRAGGAGSLVGVGGDSIVVRFREAWVGYRAWDMLELRVGLVPTLTAPTMTAAWGLRPVAQTAVRRFEVMQPADLGATLTFTIPDGFGVVGAGAYNGEGYRSRELNRGKNTELFAEIHPLAFVEALAPLAVIASFQLGSTGTGLARSDRLLGSLAWIHPRIAGGLGATWVMGYEDRGAQEGVLLEGWARGEPVEGLLVGARFQHFLRDFDQDSDALTELTATVGYRVHGVAAAFLAVDGRFAGDAAASALPGYERWRIRVVLEGRFSHPFEVSLR